VPLANLITLFLFGQIIIDINAQTKFIDSTFVIQSSGLQIGNQYNPYDLAQSIKRLYSLKVFETIEAETTRVLDGIKIKFLIKELPTLKEFKFFGNQRVKTKELLDKTKIKIGEIVSFQKLFEWKQTIQEWYKEKGYLLANISIEKTEADSNNYTTVIFKIVEGGKIRIKKISILGNEYISAHRIKQRMSNKEKKWFRKGIFNEDSFKEDLNKIIDLYRENGYLDARVVDYEFTYDSSDVKFPSLVINIYLTEGRRYFIGEISFKGASVVPESLLRTLLAINTGQVYDIKKVNKSLTELQNYYAEEGYIYAQIIPSEEIHNDTIDIIYRIMENKPARIRLVIIEGNERTSDKVIRRQITTLPGSIFKRSEIIRSQRNIFNLGYFSDIKLDYHRVDEEGNIDLIYQVKEKSSFGTIGAGISYSAQDKLTGYLELSQPNLFGKGQQLNLKLEKGGAKTNVEFGFLEPYFYDLPLSLGFNLSYLTRVYEYYDKEEKSLGINFAASLPLDYTKVYTSLRVSDVYIPPNSIKGNYQISGPYNIYQDTVHKTTLTPSINFVRDSRDYIFNPLSGNLLSYSVEISALDIMFHRHILDGSIYLPFFKKFCLMMRTRWGIIESFRTNDKIPVYERFLAGGTGLDGIRGYPDRSIGTYEGGYNIGGKIVNIYSLEYRFRPSPQLALLAFIDAGNSWNSVKDFNLSNLKRGAGIGVRLEIPMVGLIGFDLGYGFDRSDKGKWEPHLQIGRAF
jgi:outer membrane protein insertion porin family